MQVVMDADVMIVGAGPTGLMLAVELQLAGVRALVLERHLQPREIAKAGGLNGRILEFLRYRGLRERFDAAGTGPSPALRLPFGGLHVDFTQMAEPPMELLLLPQPRLERLLAELAGELGAEIRRGHEVVGLSQDDAAVTADVRGPDGERRLTARYLVGCDGAYSRVRELAGIPFPGVTYPEVQRLAQVAVPDSVTVLEDGDVEVAGFGRIKFGFTPTERGVFALGSTNPERMGLYTSEEETTDYRDDEPMTVTELRDSVRRVLGVDLPLRDATRLTRFTFHARQVERYREGRVLLAGDAAHLFPAGGVALNAGMVDSVNLGWKLAAAVHGWAPAGLLDTYHVRYPPIGANPHALAGTFAPDLALRTDQGTTSVSALMHGARPILLDLADRADLRAIAEDWQPRVEVHTAETDDRPADALLIRPDGHIAWAAALDEPADSAAPALGEALSGWFGAPLRTPAPDVAGR